MATPKIIQLNHAGASPASSRVTSCLADHQALEQSVGGYRAAAQAHSRLERVYQSAAKLIHAAHVSEIALVESATVGWTRLFYSFCAAKEQEEQKISNGSTPKKKIILISEAEYAANVVAACQWARSHLNWTVLVMPSELNDSGQSTGKLNTTMFQEMLKGNYICSDGSALDPTSIKLVCITHVPTNSGIVNPAEKMGELIAKYNATRSATEEGLPASFLPPILYLLDSCQSIGQMPVNATKIQCHGLVATGRKFLRGPRGTGFFYIPGPLASTIMPNHVDHFGLPVRQVPKLDQLQQPVETFLDFCPLPGAKRFEFWESNIAGRLALGEALDELLERGMENIQTKILELVTFLYKTLQDGVSGIALYHKPECGICTFSLKSGEDPAWIKEQLWGGEESQHRFEVSVVPSTSTPLDSARTGAPNLLRASVSYTNTKEDLVMFCQRLNEILEGNHD